MNTPSPLLSIALTLCFVLPTAAQDLATELVASGLQNPLWAGAPVDDDRVFVVEQFTGDVLVVENGAIVATFIDITSLGVAAAGEQGLLGMAFHPDYSTNGRFFLNYTRTD